MGGTKTKRGKSGNAAQYLTRNQAIKKLQLRLSEFRRLCILKGIHPREPKKKVKAGTKTYYHVKDINWLLHEPLLKTFRDLKAHERKVRRARAKANEALARRLLSAKPGVRLDHLVRERYPTFVDALRDLDDPLTLVHLFAALPAEGRHGIPRPSVDAARRLALEWQAYVVRTGALRRVFVSVKGYYYQAEVLGQAVTWLVPHPLAQVLPGDVDYRVMLTFLEFYTTLTQFVLYKLYHQLGLSYPPVLDKRLEQAAAGLVAIMHDLAGVHAAGAAARDEAAAAAAAAEAAAGAGDGAEEAPPAPEVMQRLSTLASKIRELAGSEGGGLDGAGADEDASEDSEAGALSIDSGGSEGEEGEEEEEEEEEEEGEEGGSEGAAAAGEGGEGSAGAGEDDGGEGAGGGADAQALAQRWSAADRAGGEASSSGGGALALAGDDEGELCGQLMSGCVFFLGREVPREPLMFVIRAFGGVAAWDGEGSPHQESDEAITHQVVDRPTQGHRFMSRVYVQPQWVFDTCNFRVMMPADLYAPGVVPPPHLSPFVDDSQEGYTPDWANTVRQLQEAARGARNHAAGEAFERGFLEGDAPAAAEQLPPLGDDLAAAERAYAAELTKEVRAAKRKEREEGEEEGVGSSEEEEEEEGVGGGVRAPVVRQLGAAEEEEAMKDIMMPRKKRKLYERIKRAQAGQEERAAVLAARKAALSKRAGKAQ